MVLRMQCSSGDIDNIKNSLMLQFERSQKALFPMVPVLEITVSQIEPECEIN